MRIATNHCTVLLHDIRYCRSNKVHALCETVLALDKERSISAPDILSILAYQNIFYTLIITRCKFINCGSKIVFPE